MTGTSEASRPRASFGPEVLAWLLFAICLGAMEGGVVSIMVRTFYRQSVNALTLDYTVAVLVGAPLFANLASLGWASLGQSRGLSRFLVPLQLLCVLCLLLVAAAPRNAAGLAMVVTGAVSSRLLWSGVLTLRTSVWRACYDRGERVALAGRVVAVHYLALATTGASVGALVDRRPGALPGLYLVIAGLGLGGALLYRSLSRATEEAVLDEPARREGTLRTCVAVLRGDAGFRRYLSWLFVLDGGVQMLTAPLLIGLASRFSLTHVEQTLLITAMPMIAVPVAMPLLARRLGRMHVVRFRSLHSWTFVAALAFSIAGLALRAEPFLWIGAALLGIGFAGGSIAWHVGHHDFAPPELAAHYMSINVALAGVRGVFVPAIGVSLYRLAEHLAPGQGPLALLVPLGLAVAGALGFSAMARQPLPAVEGRIEPSDAPAVATPLRRLEGAVG
jgi:hypothetical protein